MKPTVIGKPYQGTEVGGIGEEEPRKAEGSFSCKHSIKGEEKSKASGDSFKNNEKDHYIQITFTVRYL